MEKRKFDINGKEYKISCNLYLNSDFKEIVIACHGFGGDKESSTIKALAEEMVLNKIGVISFDFPGHGESEVCADKLTINNCIDDINTVEDFIKKQYGKIPINIFATSFGAYLSLINIAKNNKKYKNIILRSPAINMEEIYKNNLLRESVEEYKKRGFTKLGFERELLVPYNFLKELEDNNIMEIYSNINMPKINIIQGDKDNIAPIEDTIRFRDLDKEKISLFVISGADHRMKGPGELKKAIEYTKKIMLNMF